MRALLVVLLLGGCDQLFDIERVDLSRNDGGGIADGGARDDGDVPPDAAFTCPIQPALYDEDGDSIDDRCDGCPTVPSDELDGDGDGLPNACDYDLALSGDRILFAATFADPAELGSFVAAGASYNAAGTAISLGSGGSLTTTDSFTPLAIEVHVTPSPMAMMVPEVRVGTPLKRCRVIGASCSSITSMSGSTCARISDVSAAELPRPINELQRVLVTTAGNNSTCEIRMATVSVNATGVGPLATGAVAVEAIATTAQVRSVVIYGAQ